MVRLAIVGVIVAVAFILYALVDAAMSDPRRSRGVSKPVWVVIVVVLPVIGALLWFTIGKGRGPIPSPAKAPDDDPNFSGTRMSDREVDEHLKELEARLRELDDEVYPGVDDAVDGDVRSNTAHDEKPASETEMKNDTPSDATPDSSAKPEGDSAGEPR